MGRNRHAAAYFFFFFRSFKKELYRKKPIFKTTQLAAPNRSPKNGMNKIGTINPLNPYVGASLK